MVTVSKFYSRTIRQGAVPSNPGNVDQPDAIPPVLNPPGSNPSPAVEHNNTLNKQGGQEDEYYHLTEDQLEGLQELLSPPDIDRISQIGTITFNTSTSISADDWKAIFSGVELDDTPLTLDPVTGTPTDYSRIDSVYYKPDGTIGYETGAEDPDGAQFPPSIPAGTLRMADILRGTDGSNVIDYITEQLSDFVSKSEEALQTIQSPFAIAPLAGSDPNYTVIGPNGQLYRSRTDQAGIYSTLQGAGGYSRILRINLNLPAQLNYYAVIEFHGVSAAYEKGFLWVQFEVDEGGDLLTNALKCFGEFDVSKYTLVKVDADHYDLFVAHVGANDFYKFRPLANFGGSSIYTYYQLPAKVDPLPGGADYGFTNYTTGVQSVTGDGVDNTDPDNPVLSFPTPAEIGANDDLGTDINAALTGAATPSAGNVFATMADVGGGGADTNAVHYNADDSKTAVEKAQARENIGMFSVLNPTVVTTGFARNYSRPSNHLIGRRAINNDALYSMEAGYHGEQILFYSDNTLAGYGYTLYDEDLSSVAENRLSIPQGNFKLYKNQWVIFTYDGVLQRWVLGFPMSKSDNYFLGQNNFQSKDISTPAVRIFSTFASNGHELFGLYFNNTEKGISAKRQGIEFGKQIVLDASVGIYFNSSGGQFQFSNGLNAGGFWLAQGGNGYLVNIFEAIATTRALKGFTGGNLPNNGSTAGLTENYSINANGRFVHVRSGASNESIRRDEQRLHYLVSVTTAGAINDQALTAGIFNYRFTAATDISGLANGETGRTIDVDNNTGSNLTLLHENAGSIASNRIKLIGAADLVIPIDGKVTLKFCTGGRWELVSKNF